MKRIYLIVFFFLAAFVAFLLSLNFQNIQNNGVLDEGPRRRIEAFQKGTQESSIGSSLSNDITTITDNKKIFNVAGTIEDLMYKQKSMRCTFRTTEGETKISGIIYTDGKNIKSTLLSNTAGQYIEANTLLTPKYLYTWNTGAVYGISIGAAAAEESSTSIKNNTTKIATYHDYECNGWTSQASMFWKPANIQFIDLSNSVQKLKQDPCLICIELKDQKSKEDCNIKFNCK